MYKEIIKRLDGEFVTLFESEDEDLHHATILVTSNDMSKKIRSKNEFVFLNFYMLDHDQLSHGLAIFGFKDSVEAWEFLNKVPDMSAIDFMSKALEGTPNFYSDD